MPERSALFQVVQIGVESTSGTAVAATKRLGSLSIEPGIQANISTFRPMGTKYQTVAALNKEWVQARLSGQPTYTELQYPLSSVVNTGVVTAIPGTAAGSKWVFTSASSGVDTPKTFTVEQGDANFSHRFNYGIVSEFGMQFSRDGISLSGGMMGQRLTTNPTFSGLTSITSTNEVQSITTTGTPTGGSFTLNFEGVVSGAIAFNAAAAAIQTTLQAMSNIGTGNVICAGGPLPAAVTCTFQGDLAGQNLGQFALGTNSLTGGTTPAPAFSTTTQGSGPSLRLIPIIPPQVDIYLDSGSGALGTTKLTRVLNAGFSIGNRYGPLWVLDSAQTSFVTHIETEPTLEFSITLEADAAAQHASTGLVAFMRDSSTKFLRLKAVGPALENGADTNLFQLDLAGKVTKSSDFKDQDGVYAIEYTFTGVHDGGWGKAFEITLQNRYATL